MRRLPDAVQRLFALRRRAGTHAREALNGPRISSAPRRKRGALRNIRGTEAPKLDSN
jgi:hypothetical protein